MRRNQIFEVPLCGLNPILLEEYPDLSNLFLQSSLGCRICEGGGEAEGFYGKRTWAVSKNGNMEFGGKAMA